MSHFPNNLQIVEEILPIKRALLEQHNRLEYYREVKPEIDRLCVMIIFDTLQKMGWRFSLNSEFELDELIQGVRINATHYRLTERFLHILSEGGVLKSVADRQWLVRSPPVQESVSEQLSALVTKYPRYRVEFNLLGSVHTHLGKVLRGRKDPLTVLFPGGDSRYLEPLYRDAPITLFYNHLTRSVVEQLLQEGGGGNPGR